MNIPTLQLSQSLSWTVRPRSALLWLLLVLCALVLPTARAEAQVTADVNNGELAVTGTTARDVITLRLKQGDPNTVEVVVGFAPLNEFDRNNFTTIVVDGRGGDDSFLIDDTGGAFTDVEATTLNGGDGDDIINGGGGGETINGDDGNDNVTGGGIDILNGGDRNDSLAGGPGNDPHNGGPGDDTMFWVQGDGSDPIDGGDGHDTLQFFGAELVDTMIATANGPRVTFTRQPGNIVMDIGTTEVLVVRAAGGNDVVTFTAGLAGLIAMVAGGDGDDTITGGDGSDLLFGQAGNDTIIGGAGLDVLDGGDGNDTLVGGPGAGGLEPHSGGPGNDTMIWFQGDGSDVFDGGDGQDLLRFDGFDNAEIITATATNGRVSLTRNLGNILIDIGTTEHLVVNALGGNDSVTINPDLPGILTVTVNGHDGDDTIVGGNLADSLRGDGGNDTLTGGAGNDTLAGGDGNDTLTGGTGIDSHLGGAGDDLMIWRNGDGSDPIDGEDGGDTLRFDGNATLADVIAVTPNGPRVTLTRAAGNIVMNIGTTEHLLVNTLGGDDQITVGANLAALTTVTVDAGAGADTITTFGSSRLILDGNTEIDTLTFDAEGAAATVRPNALLIGGTARATHQNVEHVHVTNAASEPPTITITSPTTDPATSASAPFITLLGTAADAEGIASITWVNDRGGNGAATGSTNWTAANIPLVAGANVIMVTVEDADGNHATDVLTVTVTPYTYSLAEGATGSFFDTDILLANPNATPAPVQITYLKGDGTTVEQTLTLAATSRTTIEVDALVGLEAADMSATVTSTSALPLVVERTMRWDETGYGAHTEKATSGPATTWYFAEGSQGDFFATFLLLANPQPTANQARVEFLREGQPPVVKTFDLAPTSRLTVPGNTVPEVIGTSFGMVVTFTQPGVAERAMYFGTRVFDAGHESAGVTAPSAEWFLAEGATGSFFTTFVLLANPADTDADVTLTYLPADGPAVRKTRTLAAHGRASINLALEDATLASAAVATRVQSTVPILAERSQFWPFTPAQWYETHNSFGATSVATKWGLAEGRVGTTQQYQTFILLANANETQAAHVRITFLRTNGTTVVKTFTVAPSSRSNVLVNADVPELANEEFGALIEVTNGVGIFVERAMYSNTKDQIFAAGTNALATQLP